VIKGRARLKPKGNAYLSAIALMVLISKAQGQSLEAEALEAFIPTTFVRPSFEVPVQDATSPVTMSSRDTEEHDAKRVLEARAPEERARRYISKIRAPRKFDAWLYSPTATDTIYPVDYDPKEWEMRCKHQQRQLFGFDKTIVDQRKQIEQSEKLVPKPQQESISKPKQESISNPEGRRLGLTKGSLKSAGGFKRNVQGAQWREMMRKQLSHTDTRSY